MKIKKINKIWLLKTDREVSQHKYKSWPVVCEYSSSYSFLFPTEAGWKGCGWDGYCLSISFGFCTGLISSISIILSKWIPVMFWVVNLLQPSCPVHITCQFVMFPVRIISTASPKNSKELGMCQVLCDVNSQKPKRVYLLLFSSADIQKFMSLLPFF